MIYLDNAATTWPKPAAVTRAAQTAMLHFGANPGRSGHDLAMATAEEVFSCREAAAHFFHAPAPECVAFTLNCTHAVNYALKGFLRPGDHVVISNLEHNAVMRPLHALTSQGITYDAAVVTPGDDEATLHSFAACINERTRLIACLHASNVFGVKLPVARIGALAHDRGIAFLVDGAQSAGVAPIHMETMHIDFLCVPGHKGLYGPMGSGMLITARGEELRTIIEGGSGNASKEITQPAAMPEHLESGTLATSAISGLKAGIDFVRSRGIQAIAAHEMALVARLYSALRSIEGVRLYTDRPSQQNSVPLLSFNIGEMPSSEVADLCNRRGVAVRAGLHCAPAAHRAFGTLEQGTVRVCPSLFTTSKDIAYIEKVVAGIALATKLHQK